jgi:hypothetical protein
MFQRLRRLKEKVESLSNALAPIHDEKGLERPLPKIVEAKE